MGFLRERGQGPWRTPRHDLIVHQMGVDIGLVPSRRKADSVAAEARYPDQAARVLGVSVDAVRKRAERGQLPHEKEGNRLYILLDDVETRSGDDVAGESGALSSPGWGELP